MSQRCLLARPVFSTHGQNLSSVFAVKVRVTESTQLQLRRRHLNKRLWAGATESDREQQSLQSRDRDYESAVSL